MKELPVTANGKLVYPSRKLTPTRGNVVAVCSCEEITHVELKQELGFQGFPPLVAAAPPLRLDLLRQLRQLPAAPVGLAP